MTSNVKKPIDLSKQQVIQTDDERASGKLWRGIGLLVCGIFFVLLAAFGVFDPSDPSETPPPKTNISNTQETPPSPKHLPSRETDMTSPTSFNFNIDDVTTPSGLSLWHRQDDTAPVISVRFFIAGGTRLDPVGKEGLAALMADMMTQGAGNRTSSELQSVMREHGIKIRFKVERDGIYGLLKTTLTHKDLAIDLLRDVLTAPRFDAEDLERLRARQLSELKFNMAEASYHAQLKAFATIFDGHAYARPTQGTLETIPKLTRDDLVAAHRDWFRRARLTLASAGDMTAADAASWMDTAFSALPEGAEFDVRADIASPNFDGQQYNTEWQGPQAAIAMGHPAIARTHPDWFKARIADYLFGGGGFSSRLMDEIRVKRGLTYGIYTTLIDYDAAPILFGQAQVAKEKVDETIAVIREEMVRIRDKGVTAEELSDAQSYLTGSFALNFSTTQAIASIMLQMRRDDLPLDYIDHRNTQINAITLEELNAFIAEWLDPAKMTFAVAK